MGKLVRYNERYEMSTDHPEDTNHGDSIAAWTSVTVIMLAVAGATVSYLIGNDPGVLISGIVIVVGIALGPILKALGFGVKK
jgi:VIT1/CCC1 family predicted Fe2+/Mn2+ transporter